MSGPESSSASSPGSSTGSSTEVFPPWLPPAEIVTVAGRGEFFVRRHEAQGRTDSPTVLLLHGWTASADLQFLGLYRELAAEYSFLAIDHRGHGRGLRTLHDIELSDLADDAAAVVEQLGLGPVIAVGYSMGGPIALHLARRHRDLVAGLVLEATALEWRATLRERVSWWVLPFFGIALRSSAQPWILRRAMHSLLDDDHEFAPYRAWMVAETLRNEPRAVVSAGRALSRYDARRWVAEVPQPARVLITTEDRLVRPRKQRRLAAALDAPTAEVPMDHLGAIESPGPFAAATLELIRSLVDR